MGSQLKGWIGLVCAETPLDSMGAKHMAKEGKQVKGEGQPSCSRKPDDREEGQQAWEKVLYKNQPFPDNYTNGSILSDLVGEGGMGWKQMLSRRLIVACWY